MQEVVVQIDKKGSVRIEAENFAGPSCTLATQPYVNALGAKVGDLPKGEMFETEKATQQLTT